MKSTKLTPENRHLFYLFSRIEDLYNQGNKPLIEAIKALVDAFESKKGSVLEKKRP